jgi:hypothetical protein
MTRATGIVVLALALAGCAEGSNDPGFGGDPASVRGDVDAGGTADASGTPGTGGRASGAGGAVAGGGFGVGGAVRGTAGAGAGGMTGSGGMTGTGGSGAGGTPAPADQFCSNLGYAPGYAACFKEPSPGVFLYGSTADGHACVSCLHVPATVECWASAARELCVASCSECTFQ